MKLLQSGDFHVGLSNFGREIEEFGESFDSFVDEAIEAQVDLAIAAGDTFHGRRPGPKELRIISSSTRRLVDAKIPFVMGTGNHDGMSTIADPESQTLGWLDALALPGVYIGIRPSIFIIPGVAVVACLPYAHKRAIDDASLTIRERTDESSRILEQTIAEMAERVQNAGPKDLPRIFVGHLTTESAKLGAEAAMQMGWDTMVDPSVFDAFDYAAIGHIHVGQQVSDKAWYAGSPDVHAFGEEAADKHFLLAEVQRGMVPVVRAIPTNPRPLIRIVATEAQSWIEATEQPVPDGAIVHLELRPEGKMTPGTIRTVVQYLRDHGAAFIQTVVVEPEGVRSRTVGVEAESPIPVQIDAWLATADAPESTKVRAREIALRAVSIS